MLAVKKFFEEDETEKIELKQNLVDCNYDNLHIVF